MSSFSNLNLFIIKSINNSLSPPILNILDKHWIGLDWMQSVFGTGGTGGINLKKLNGLGYNLHFLFSFDTNHHQQQQLVTTTALNLKIIIIIIFFFINDILLFVFHTSAKLHHNLNLDIWFFLIIFFSYLMDCFFNSNQKSFNSIHFYY